MSPSLLLAHDIATRWNDGCEALALDARLRRSEAMAEDLLDLPGYAPPSPVPAMATIARLWQAVGGH